MFDVDSDKNSEPEIDLNRFQTKAKTHSYVEQLDRIDSVDAKRFLDIGVDTTQECRSGTFIQKDSSVIHAHTCQPGVEVIGISRALKKYIWLKDYLWKSIKPEQDEFTIQAKEKPHEGYFIRALPGVIVDDPVQSCLYITKERFSQNVHNIVIVEEGAQMHIITGCATAPHLISGLHIGISEFYVKKNARLTFTMIHDWGKKINVRPRSVTHVEAGGVIVSNFISFKPVGSLKMFPTTYLDGKGAVARFNSIMVANDGCNMDVGSRIVLNAPKSRAEIISRAVTSGGSIIARGDLVGNAANIKAHLECKGLILKDGLMHAIPELRAKVPGVEMSHEAAVGKIDRQEIEYLMARGLSEEEAVSAIVRGFLNVDIEGLPEDLRKKLDNAILETQKEMM
jgi:Fe-S cluster assembly scaffold protein SufB